MEELNALAASAATTPGAETLTCKPYECESTPASKCKTCVPQVNRTSHHDCATCYPGHVKQGLGCSPLPCDESCAECKVQALRAINKGMCLSCPAGNKYERGNYSPADHSYVRLYKRDAPTPCRSVASRRPSRRLLVTSRGDPSCGRGVVDVHTIRVVCFFEMVWLDVSRGGSRWTSPQERVWGGCCSMWGDVSCLAERGSKAPGSKYLPRNKLLSNATCTPFLCISKGPTGCASCSPPCQRKSDADCATCKPGHHVVDMKCVPFGCKIAAIGCARCLPQKDRQTGADCDKCHPGYYLVGKRGGTGLRNHLR